MATENKPVLGYMQCLTCGERGSVHAAAGRRNQLYKRCGCGCDQRNGPIPQSTLWYETDWLTGLKPESPPAQVLTREAYDSLGQVDRKSQQSSGLQADDKTGQQTDFNPDDKPADVVESESKTGLMWLAAGAVGILALVTGR